MFRTFEYHELHSWGENRRNTMYNLSDIKRKEEGGGLSTEQVDLF